MHQQRIWTKIWTYNGQGFGSKENIMRCLGCVFSVEGLTSAFQSTTAYSVAKIIHFQFPIMQYNYHHNITLNPWSIPSCHTLRIPPSILDDILPTDARAQKNYHLNTSAVANLPPPNLKHSIQLDSNLLLTPQQRPNLRMLTFVWEWKMKHPTSGRIPGVISQHLFQSSQPLHAY